MDKILIESIFLHSNYLDISDDEKSLKEKTESKQKVDIESRSRSRSRSSRKKSKFDKDKKEDEFERSNNYKYKRYDRHRDSSSSNSGSNYRDKIRNRKEKDRKTSRVADSGSNKNAEIINKSEIIIKESETKTRPSFFGEKKSKWTTVEDDNSKQKEPQIIQVNPNKMIEIKEKPKVEDKPQQDKPNIMISRYTPPVNSYIPDKQWRLYAFKDKEKKEIYKIDSKSYYIIGKEEKLCNIVINHPSCSRQHAVIQFLKNEKENTISINLIDLKSTNGTFINKLRLEPGHNYELKVYDVINFGNSSRDYVVMLEQ